ncbi:NifB/NifX family molybdenum-iron cluster-binding protein [Aceticella autotrophica]|uniref:NifB/NifX family molybdenum-iron cluster-binding protein n=1 Tax=Aceticella autotrophica TaxID=2755338 RepID=A0A975AV45_9THEO|nr:NifB/NifX family molybdenum-iron cluster-binding protein [Aceticella autotrophica]QSZ26988.1 NifB/NifX family molybdenum-iron cluster-binding protein [Aceticella autotrophica]
MKIAVSSEGSSIDSKMDTRFGRAEYFIIVDNKTMEYEAIKNSAAAKSGGAGTEAAQQLVNKGVEAVISSNVGPNAMDVLVAANIPAYKASNLSIKEAVEHFNKGLLEKISEPTNKGLHGRN